ncbi:hypothetical protein V5P93_000182 [Actinokineospora auranticolor]|uniref:Arabinofuranosyltransferase n=1 Tax=Actinokineospora auranticolor TaxID=155976 RepID=A0A2S6GL01_9PSEU|nr:hypothetical protein [Actinokineospora auranticolor]PPK65924.1 arabinofuranosyltransferase [Actinokineospora auranticolor]
MVDVATDVTTAPAPGPATEWWRRPRVWTGVVFAAVLLVFLFLAWQRRWMSDDGLIVLRTVRNIFEGNGPVYNAGERVEANTSTLWTVLVTLGGLLPGVRLEWVAVIEGLLCAVAGLGFAMDGARRLHPGDGRAVFLPAGAVLVVVLPPFRDFATSGLETGLISLWLGLSWWVVVRLAVSRGVTAATGPAVADDAPPRAVRTWPVALVLGLGPLVRPDLALFSAVGFAAVLFIAWQGWRRALAWVGAAAAIPLAYQVFRMGYYGVLTPNTAIAKEAGTAHWLRGLGYLHDFAKPYLVWVPVLLLAAGARLLVRRLPRTRPMTVLLAFPLVAGLALALYVIRIGGDFMHGRMLLPALFTLLLPVMVLPVAKWHSAVVAGVGAWGVVALGWFHVPHDGDGYINGGGIADERGYWADFTGHDYPITADDYRGLPAPVLSENVALIERLPGSRVVLRTSTGWHEFPSDRPYSSYATTSIGAAGMLIDVDVRIQDVYGLVNPLAAHTEMVKATRPGHEKQPTMAWTVGEAGTGELAATGPVPEVAAADIQAAQRAVACPEIAELIASYREPLTAGRFWDNLTGAFHRTGVRYPADPKLAANCGG